MSTNLKNTCVAGIESFHSEEDGIEGIQALVILAIAAVALFSVKNQWTTISEFFKTNIQGATTGWTPTAAGQ